MEERINEIEPKVIELAERGYSFKTSVYINQGWEKFKEKPAALIVPMLVIGLGVIGIMVVLLLISEDVANLFSNVLQIALAPLGAGFYLIAHKVFKGDETELQDVFDGYKMVVPIVLYTIVSAIFLVFGFLFFLLPGIYLAVAYSFTIPFIAIKNYDFWPAMEASRKVITKNWWSFFGFTLLLGLINIAGFLMLGLGLLITIPVSLLASYAAFKDVILSLDENEETDLSDNLLLE